MYSVHTIKLTMICSNSGVPIKHVLEISHH